MDFGQVLHFTFDWRKTRSFFKYIGLVWLLCLLFFVSIAGLVFLLFRDLALALLSGSYSSFNAMLVDPMLAGATAITFFFSSIPIVVIFVLLVFFVQALMTVFALKQVSLKGIRLNPIRFFTLFFIAIASFLAAVVSFYNKKMLLLPLFGTIFLFGSIAPIPSLHFGSIVLSLILFLAYFVVIIYNLVRLCFSCVVFLNKDGFLSHSINESWEITSGSVWKIIAAFLMAILLVGVASLMILISFSLFVSFIFSIYFAANFFVSLVLSSFVVLIILCPFQLLCFTFAKVSIYDQLSKGTNSPLSL